MEPKRVEIRELDPDIIPPLDDRVNDPNYSGGSKIVIIGKPGCFAKGTLVAMYDGTFRKVEDVKVGDLVLGDDASPRKVLSLCRGIEPMYKITPRYGYSYVVNENHILTLKKKTWCSGLQEVNIRVGDYAQLSKRKQRSYLWFKRSCFFNHAHVDVEPHMLGYFLGLANQTIETHPEVTSGEEWLAAIKSELQDFLGVKPSALESLNKFSRKTRWDVISPEYMINSSDVRWSMLSGIVDACGVSFDSYVELRVVNETFASSIAFLGRSMGLLVHVTRENEHSFVCSVRGELSNLQCDKFVFEKRDNCKVYLEGPFKLTKQSLDWYYGFELDRNHKFMLEDFSVTHNSGKTTLIKGLLYAKRHIFPIGMTMSGSEDTNHAFAEFMPSTFVYNDYDEEKIKDFIRRQKLAKAYVEVPWGVMVLDDCTDDPSIFNRTLQKALYKKGRHWKMMYILSLQYAMDAKAWMRTMVDGVFILREAIEVNREKIYRNYASIIPTYDLFCQLMDQLTEDYTAIYIHNFADTNDWTKCVYYWKAPIVPKNWKLGCDEYWDFHKQRYNPDYIESTDF